jgi:WD40 repeat protein
MFLSKLKLGLSAVLCAGLLLAAVGGSLATVGTAQDAQSPAPTDTGAAVGKADNDVPLDADGRALPAGAIQRLGSRRYRVEGRSQFALPTPDGKHILVQPQPPWSAYAAQGLMLLDAETGLRVRTFEDSRRVPKLSEYYSIRPAAFSPDGTKLYAIAWDKSEETGEWFDAWASLDLSCKRILLVWDVATGKRLVEWELPAPGLRLELPPAFLRGSSMLGVTMSPDGKRVFVYGAIRMRTKPNRSVVGVPGVHVLDAVTGKKLQTWEEAGYPIGTIADGKEVVTYHEEAALTARDVETGKPVRSYPLAGFVSSAVLSPDGKTLAAVGVSGHPDKPTGCEIKLWEAATGREVRRLTADVKAVTSAHAPIVFAADGKTLYLGTGSGRMLRWDLSDGRALPDWPSHRGIIVDLCRRPGTNELVSAGQYDGALCRWDAATGRSLSATDAYVGEVAVARTRDGKGVVAVDAAGRLDVWDVTTGRVTKTLQTPGRAHHKLLFTSDGKQLLLAAQTGPNTIWDLTAGKQIGELFPPPKKDPKADEYWWGTLNCSPDGRRIVASKYGRGTWMWAWPDRTILWHEAKAHGCYFSPDGDTIVCAGPDDTIEIRDSQTGVVKQTAPGRDLYHVAFSPNRRRMVTAHGPEGIGSKPSHPGAWCVRDAATGAVLKEVKMFHYPWSFAFSPSGWLLAVAGDNTVRVYDTATWIEIARFDGHEGTVKSVFFGPDEATLISASPEDGTALVWSLKPSGGRESFDATKLWADLAGDGLSIRQAVWSAAQHTDAAIKLFREKWPIPKGPLDPKQVAQLLTDLDHPDFAKREAATAELAKLGRRAEAELRKELAETASAEVRRRAEKLLAPWSPYEAAEYPAADARELRAVWALELADTPEARTLLAQWAAAKVGNRLCEEAEAALKRLQRKKADRH